MIQVVLVVYFIATQYFFATFLATEIDMDSSSNEASPRENIAPGKRGRPPQIYLKSASKLISVAEATELCGQWNVEFRSALNENTVIKRGTGNIQSAKSHFDRNNLS
jgi:hypothetical protein